jgi:hypothetical protein
VLHYPAKSLGNAAPTRIHSPPRTRDQLAYRNIPGAQCARTRMVRGVDPVGA